MIKQKKQHLLFLLMLFFSYVQAQESLTLSLQEARSYALEHNKVLQNAKTDLEIKEDLEGLRFLTLEENQGTLKAPTEDMSKLNPQRIMQNEAGMYRVSIVQTNSESEARAVITQVRKRRTNNWSSRGTSYARNRAPR